MSKKQVWVSPNSAGGWRVHSSSASRDTAHIDNKSKAIEMARGIAKHQEAELLIQKSNGRISVRNSYGRDPFPPKG